MNWMPVSYILSIYADVYYPCILKQNHYLNDLVRSDQRANSYCKPNQVHIKLRTNFLYDIYKYILCFCSCFCFCSGGGVYLFNHCWRSVIWWQWLSSKIFIEEEEEEEEEGIQVRLQWWKMLVILKKIKWWKDKVLGEIQLSSKLHVCRAAAVGTSQN